MKKILQVLTDTNIGGAGIYLLNYLAARDRDDFETAVVLPRGAALTPSVEKTGARVIEAEKIADRSYSKEGTNELCAIFRREKPDLVHTHASLSARIAAKKCKIPIVNTRHCLEDPKPFPKNLIYRALNNALSDRVIAVSRAVEENLLRDGIARKKLRMIYNGIPPQPQYTEDERNAFREEFGLSGVCVGIVARLEPVKNHTLFLRAAELCALAREKSGESELTFVIAGGGSLENDLRERAKTDAPHAKVLFLGQVENVSRLFCALDVAVLTSTHEALSLSLIEAMAQGRPVVSTRSGGPEELITPNENGFLCGHDEKSLSEAILALARDGALREKFGRAGKARAAEFSAENMARKIEDVYRELLK